LKIIGRLKQYYTKVMDIPDAPIKIARGAALGVAMDFLPIPLISIPIAYLAARLAGGNGVAAALTAAFFKWAVPFFYVLNVATGSLVLGFGEFDKMEPVMKMDGFTPSDWLNYLTRLGYPFLAGAAINSFLTGLMLFFIVRRILILRQKRKGII
jgi:hypothetical protein